MPHALSVEAETELALKGIRTEFKAEFELMDEVLAYVQSMLTAGKLVGTKPRGLDAGVIYLCASILAKGCKTFRSIKAAACAGCGQDASILLRALFESTIAMLYILQRDSKRRSILYAAHENQRQLVLIEEARNTPGQKRFFKKADLEKARATVDRWKALASAADVASVRKHWAGPGGLQAACRTVGRGWMRLYTMMYRYLSSFSHGSDPHAHMFLHKDGETPVLKLLPGIDELNKVIPMACIHLLAMAERFNDRLGLGHDAQLKSLSSKALTMAKARAGLA